jgi:hypothetical protein
VVVTGGDGTVSLEAPLGKVEVSIGRFREEAWVGLDQETVVDVRC